VEANADALDTTFPDLLGANDRAQTEIFSGVMHTPDDILKHEAEVFEWEREGTVRRMVLPFFSVIHQTDEFALYIRKNGCYNYSPMEGNFSPEQRQRFEEIHRIG
jgi:hypothetical protein